MSEENKTVELNNDELEKVDGGTIYSSDVKRLYVFKRKSSNSDYGYISSLDCAKIESYPDNYNVKFCHGSAEHGTVLLGTYQIMNLEKFRMTYNYKNPVVMSCKFPINN